MSKPRLNRTLSLMLAAAIGITVTTGCLSYRVTARANADPDKVTTISATRNLFFWGNLGNRDVDVDCGKETGIYQVRVSTTFLQGLATGLTLGIWCPATIEYQCATVKSKKGKIPIPGAGSDKTDPSCEHKD